MSIVSPTISYLALIDVRPTELVVNRYESIEAVHAMRSKQRWKDILCILPEDMQQIDRAQDLLSRLVSDSSSPRNTIVRDIAINVVLCHD